MVVQNLEKPILYLTGASGFIGGALKRAFASEYDIRPLFRDLVSQPEKLELAPNSTLIHCSGRVHVYDETAAYPIAAYRTINRELTVKLAEKALQSGVGHFIFLSSFAVYGSKAMGVVEEETKPSPESPYGVSKWEAELALQELFCDKLNRCTILRLPMVYGPENKGNMLTLLKCASRGLPLPLMSATAKRSFLFIGNLCDAVRVLIKPDFKVPGGVSVYALTDQQDLSSSELYSMISMEYSGKRGILWVPKWVLDFGMRLSLWLGSLTGIKLPISDRTIAQLFDGLCIDPRKFREDYGWKAPAYTVEAAVKETVKWYRRDSFRAVPDLEGT